MAARKKTAAVRRPTRRKEALARIESELPPTLKDFSRRVHRELTVLENRVEKAAAPARREIARVLRQASHALGRYEAEGERQWKRLTGQARREALAVLHKLEKVIEEPRARAAAAGRTAARKVRRRRAA